MKFALSFTVAIFFSLRFLSASLAQPTEQIVPFTNHTGYTVKQGMAPSKGFQGYVIYRKSNLTDIYDPGKRMPSDTIDFKRNMGITMMGAKSPVKVEIRLAKVTLHKGTLSMYFTSKKGKKLATPQAPGYVGTIQRQLGVTGLRFFMDGKLLEEIYH